MCCGCYRIMFATIPACCFYSKTERKSTYECVRCLKAFMNNKVSHDHSSSTSLHFCNFVSQTPLTNFLQNHFLIDELFFQKFFF